MKYIYKKIFFCTCKPLDYMYFGFCLKCNKKIHKDDER